MFLILFAQAALLDLLILISGVSISFRQISRFFSFFFSFLSVQRAYFLKLTLFGRVNVDGVFLGNKLVDSRMALLFLATVFERAICFVLKVADQDFPFSVFLRKKKFHDCVYGYYFVCFSIFMTWRGLFNDGHFKFFWEFTKPFFCYCLETLSID